ncbi:hypothetical protein [Ralstonia mannitolilytica]|uniref:hypothetical protein n=1 Tax=Ralstonia mannitolilytica TaxID=105219 RepID=UPI0028F661C4|nr:hypothetical protein [Ralstonia mannitolilytica]CAJ0742300.1 hypothetical protein R76696_03912 [Ralstonia mannitolilytica]
MFAPDPKWLEIFKLPLRTAIAVAIASCALLALVFAHILDLGPIGPFALPVLIIAAVASTAMAVVGIVDGALAPARERRKQSALEQRRAIRRKEQDERREEARKAAISRLDYLSREEIAVVVKALHNDSPTFYTYVFSPPVSMLQGKGLVWTTGGTHHEDHYPFSFHDFVWKVILERKEEFLAQEAQHRKAEEERKKAERQRRGY